MYRHTFRKSLFHGTAGTLLLTFLVAPSAEAHHRDITPNNCMTLQAAVSVNNIGVHIAIPFRNCPLSITGNDVHLTCDPGGSLHGITGTTENFRAITVTGNDVHVTNCEIQGRWQHGILASTPGRGFKAEGNHIFGVRTNGQSFAIEAVGHQDARIENNTFHDNSTDVRLRQSPNAAVRNNRFEDTTFWAISMNNQDRTLIEGNSIHNASTGIGVGGFSTNCSIAGNTIVDSQHLGINAIDVSTSRWIGNTILGNDNVNGGAMHFSRVSQNVIEGNTVLRAQSSGFLVNGNSSGNLLRNNTFDFNGDFGVVDASSGPNIYLMDNDCFANSSGPEQPAGLGACR